MIDNGWLGQKSKQGFYKKIDKGVIHSLDFETMNYTPQNKKRYKGVGLARENTNINSKLRALVNSEDIAGEFTWEVFSKTLPLVTLLSLVLTKAGPFPGFTCCVLSTSHKSFLYSISIPTLISLAEIFILIFSTLLVVYIFYCSKCSLR